MRPSTCLLAAAAIAAAASPAAAAAAPWSAPLTISAPHTFAQPVGLGPTGSSAAWWQWQQGVRAGAQVGASYATRAAGAAFGPERALAFTGELLDVRGYGNGRLLALSQSAVPRRTRREPLLYRVRVADATPAGSSAPVTVARDIVGSRPELDATAGGRAIVSYLTWVPRTNRVLVRVVTRSSSGRWSRPAVISGRGQVRSVAAAIGRRGDLVVAYVHGQRVRARVRRPGRGWGPVQTLASPDGPTQWALRAAVGDHGDVQVVWRKLLRRNAARPSRRLLQASRITPTGSRFATARTIQEDGASPPSELVAIPGGFAVGYTIPENAPGTHTIARVALLRPGAGPPLDVAGPSGGVRDVRVAWSPRLGLLATMVQPTATGNGDGIGVGALLAPGADRFGPLERVTPAENVHELAPGVDRDGTPVAVWSARPEGTGPGIPIDSVRSVVRTATRTG